ncbi:beta-glucosidase [Hansschlegelia sp.]|uniref:beta-glucosidase n=1 Tax=Hansschlegelia sp. TaxID=2041892 RepID=UPI002D15CD7A|nr:beta-glucosidase [Hansschlegelia sp.]HVI28071.1 beta-glucosidase [Hansschlegelia sp.]
MPPTAALRSFFLAGFECAAQKRADGRRLDLLASTGHDVHVRSDYALLAAHGMRAARDGMRWHRIELSPGFYDWSSVAPMAQAAAKAGVQVIWDLCHYGYPDKLDIWSAAFPERFARFAKAATRFLCDQSDDVPYFCPVNEISFWAWAGGDMARFNPTVRRRGAELKRQLVRATIAAIDAVREVEPRARFICAEPSINVFPASHRADDHAAAENYRLSQFEAHDMLIGRVAPELGGSPDKLDIVGLNFYPDNQWVLGGGAIPMGHHDYKPFHEMLAETHHRYGRPVIVSETGAEHSARPAWLNYVAGEVAAAREAGVPVEGLCLYPIIDYPGWENDRLCAVGLFGAADENGRRAVYRPLAEELERQQVRFEQAPGAGPGATSDWRAAS